MDRKALPKGTGLGYGHLPQKRIYGYFQAIFMSFYSVEIYVDVRHRWKGFGALYCFLLIAILTLPWALYWGLEGNKFYNNIFLPSLAKLPVLKIEKGELLYPANKRFIIKHPETQKAMIIIDTSGALTNLPNETYPDATLLFTRYALITKYGKAPTDVERYGADMTGEVDGATLKPLFDYLRKTFLIMLYPNLAMLWFGLYFSILAVLSFILKMFSVILMKYRITYKEALRLAIVSATPMLCLHMLGYAFGLDMPTFRWTFFFIFWGYFIFAIRSNKFAARYPLII